MSFKLFIRLALGILLTLGGPSMSYAGDGGDSFVPSQNFILTHARPGTGDWDLGGLFKFRTAEANILAKNTGSDSNIFISGASVAAGFQTGTLITTGLNVGNMIYTSFPAYAFRYLNNLTNVEQGTSGVCYFRYAYVGDESAAHVYTQAVSQGFPSGNPYYQAFVNYVDSRTTITGSATDLSTQNAAGGNAIVLTAVGDQENFTPQTSCYTNEAIVYYESISGGGSFQPYQVISGTATAAGSAISCAGTDAINKATITLGSRVTGSTIRLQATATGGCRILAIEDVDTSVPAMHVFSGAFLGASVENFDQSDNSSIVSSPYNFFATIAPALYINSDGMVNDLLTYASSYPNAPPAALLTDVQQLITLGQVSGSVVMFLPYYVQPGYFAPLSTQLNWNNAEAALAASNKSQSPSGINYINGQYLDNYSLASTNGYLYSDDTHLTNLGAIDAAQGILQLLQAF